MNQLPIPPHFDPDKVGVIRRVPYQEIAQSARDWSVKFHIPPAVRDRKKICLILVDVQNTFCIPGFELFVGGRSGTGAVDDNRRLCEFIYGNLPVINQIVPTLDTHQAMQIFHSIFLIDENGKHPDPFTLIAVEDIVSGKWKFNPAIGENLGISSEYGQKHLLHYTRQLRDSGKYELTIWPYHAMIGGIGHALVPAIEEAIFFHTIARYSQPDFQIKGDHPLTEHYSVLGPEVVTGPEKDQLAKKNQEMIARLLRFDAVIIAGQAKSHCVAWTISDLLNEVSQQDKSLVEKIYLLEDCTSPVVIPGVIDYTDQADAAFSRFAAAGMNVVKSTDPIEGWPGMEKIMKFNLNS